MSQPTNATLLHQRALDVEDPYIAQTAVVCRGEASQKLTRFNAIEALDDADRPLPGWWSVPRSRAGKQHAGSLIFCAQKACSSVVQLQTCNHKHEHPIAWLTFTHAKARIDTQGNACCAWLTMHSRLLLHANSLGGGYECAENGHLYLNL